MSKTALTNKSNLNEAHDIWIRTYKQTATAATTNQPDITKGRKKLNNQINKDNKNSNNNYKRLVIKHSKII